MKNYEDKPTVAILGYGSQGRAVALNLRDSGFKIKIGLRSDSKSIGKANSDRFVEVVSPAQAVLEADVVCFAIPDHSHGKLFEEIKQNLKPGCCLWFLHGLSVHFGYLKPTDNFDIILIAPHAPGVAVREKYLSDRSISAFLAIHQDFSGKSEDLAIELANGLGFASDRLVKTSFKHEALGDLFGEQAVLCGGLAMLIKSGFEVLTEKGIPAENAYLEVAYQLDLIIKLIKEHGINGMFDRISVAAKYGSLLNGPKIIDSSVKERMLSLFDDIESGEFSQKLQSLSPDEISQLPKMLEKLTHPDLEKMAKKHSRQ